MPLPPLLPDPARLTLQDVLVDGERITLGNQLRELTPREHIKMTPLGPEDGHPGQGRQTSLTPAFGSSSTSSTRGSGSFRGRAGILVARMPTFEHCHMRRSNQFMGAKV